MAAQEAPGELSRFEPGVIAAAPALAIWQVGPNAVFHTTKFIAPARWPRRSQACSVRPA